MMTCLEEGYLQHPYDCQKFFKCASRGNLPCLCKCRWENSFFDLSTKRCEYIDWTMPEERCRHIKKILNRNYKVDGKHRHSLQHPVFQLLEEIVGTRNHKSNMYGNESQVAIIVDDNFPVWAISLFASTMVTVAVGFIVYYY